MTPEEIANHVAVMIEALRDASGRQNAYVKHMILTPEVVAAAVAAYLRECTRDPR